MKKTVSLILSLLIALLTSCTESVSAIDIAVAFCGGYPIDAKVYSSSASEGEEGYIDAEMLNVMFGISERPVEEFALVLYGKVSTVRELGVFVTKNSDERMEITELAMSRISFLSSFVEGEGFVKKYRTVTVYGFVDDASRAEMLLDNLI
jgi:hypothetical protein